MSKSREPLSYHGKYLVGPAIAYGSYILLTIVALIKQTAGNKGISFMFLCFWGVWVFLIAVLLSLAGFVHKKGLRYALIATNVVVSLVLIVLAFSAIFVIHKTQVSSYACEDYVRCLIKVN